MAIVKLYDYTVTGSNRFPLDMLRYDHAWPATQGDVTDINLSGNVRSGPDDRAIRIHSNKAPTVERWASFGWRVDALHSQKVS